VRGRHVTMLPEPCCVKKVVAMKLELPAQKKWVHTMTLPIRWGDMDAMGHVNNTVYFRYMEVARVEWLLQVAPYPRPEGQGGVVVNAFCNFIRQFTFPGEVLMRSYLGAVGRSSFEIFQEMSLVDDPDTLCATGGATMVWIDVQSQKSIPLPDTIRQRLQAV